MSELVVTPPEGIEANNLLYRWLYKIYLRLENAIWLSVDRNAVVQSIPNNAATTVAFNNVVADTIGGWDNAAYTYTAQVGGPYTVIAKGRLTGNLAAGKTFYMAILVNNVSVAQARAGNVALTDPDITVIKDIKLRKGDVVKIQAFQDTGGALDLYGTTTHSYLTIKRIN